MMRGARDLRQRHRLGDRRQGVFIASQDRPLAPFRCHVAACFRQAREGF